MAKAAGPGTAPARPGIKSCFRYVFRIFLGGGARGAGEEGRYGKHLFQEVGH